MKLWNDYEGKTIAETYPLKKLLWPEGRSAFFATSAQDGAVDVIRITESLNDEHEMLERWRQVSEVHQANLVEIKTYGATTFDGVPLTYALMESTDGSLAEILKERPLTAAETMQVATSVLAALSALHSIGLVHEHIEPASVVATGEIVKLRSDCVRECLVDPEFHPQSMCDELRQRDVQDLAVLLLQCLTLERQWTSAVALPAPFDRIVRHGLEGTWTLEDMRRALHGPAESPLAPAEMLAGAEPHPVAPADPDPGTPSPVPAGLAGPEPPPPTTTPDRTLDFAEAPEAVLKMRVDPDVSLTTRRLHLRRLVASTVSREGVPGGWFLAGGLVLLVLLVMFFWTRTPASAGPSPAPAALVAAPSPASNAPAAERVASPAKETHTPLPAGVPQPGWHVIAYTYLHETQAAAKAATVARQHPGLNPRVFAPAGRSPYFVALGGGMSESEAAAVLRIARRDGLPRDTFIRLYRTR